MSRRFQVFSAAAITLSVALLLQLVPVSAQAPVATGAAAKASGPELRTIWGDPDLQGLWTDGVSTPLQRDPKLGDREFYTDEERAAIDKARNPALLTVGDKRPTRGTPQDVGGAYNSVFRSQLYSSKRTSLIIDPPDGRIPPRTEEAKKRRQMVVDFENALLAPTDICKNKLVGCSGGTYGPTSPLRETTPPFYVSTSARGGTSGAINRANGPEDRNLGERCLRSRFPGFTGGLGFFPRIVQSRDAVSIYYDISQGGGFERIIPISNAPHLPAAIRQWWGDSRGHWEGDTLVVDVTNFNQKRDYQGARENLHLVERFTRLDANTIEYEVTIEDPTTWTRPWTAKVEWTKTSDELNRHYMEPRCHEGNYGLAGQLIGARHDERNFAEGKGPDPATLCSAGCGSTLPE